MPTTRTYSDLIHIPIALGVMLITCLIAHWSVPFAGAYAGFFACFYREVTQEEYRWIEANGGLRALMPRAQGLKFWQWNKHSILETVYAGAACVVVAVALTFCPL